MPPSPPLYTPLSSHDTCTAGSSDAEETQFSRLRGLRAALPTLRFITLVVGAILTIMCPIAFVDAEWVSVIIEVAPAILSGFLALAYFIRRRRGRKSPVRKQTRAGKRLVFLSDVFLFCFHLAILIAVNVDVHDSWQSGGVVMLGTWISVFIMVDTIMHLLFVLESLPDILKKHSTLKPCARCGYSGIETAGNTTDNVFEPLAGAASDSKTAHRSLGGNLVDDSEFGDESRVNSARTSQDTSGDATFAA